MTMLQAQVAAGEAALRAAIELVGAETSASLTALNHATLGELGRLMQSVPVVFVLGAGRSALALRMVAMRLMHLGLTIHVAGETTTPAISAGDLLLAASGSGATFGVVHGAEVAKRAGANIVAITTDVASPLAQLANLVVHVSAAGKADRSSANSRQYAGSLFEQTVLLAGDALFEAVVQAGQIQAEALWARHANLE